MVNSKNKGSSYERHIAKLLSNLTGVDWHRVGVSSGARATSTGKNINGWVGDVFTDNPRYKNIVIECKAYRYVNFQDLFNDKSTFWKWIFQCEREAILNDWILFFKLDRIGEFMCYKNILPIQELGIYKNNPCISLGNYHIIKIK